MLSSISILLYPLHASSTSLLLWQPIWSPDTAHGPTQPSRVAYEWVTWPIIHAYLLHSSTWHYHSPLDIRFQKKTVASSTFQTSNMLSIKDGKVTANIQGDDQHSMTIWQLWASVGGGGTSGKFKKMWKPGLWPVKKVTATKRHFPALMLICSKPGAKILPHSLPVQQIFHFTVTGMKGKSKWSSQTFQCLFIEPVHFPRKSFC